MTQAANSGWRPEDPARFDSRQPALQFVSALNEFFEPPPPSPEPDKPARYRTPPWISAPPGTLPGVVALELVLARTDQAAICVSRISAYPSGFELALIVIADPNSDLDPMLFGAAHYFYRRDREAEAGIPDEMLRFGVQFANGSKATNAAGNGPLWGLDEKPTAPVMNTGDGGGGDDNWHQDIWVWPLPPPGPLTFVCQWPAAGIPLTRQKIDAQPILDASSHAQVIFSDEHLPDLPTGGPVRTIIR